jgi:hypothetical protein
MERAKKDFHLLKSLQTSGSQRKSPGTVGQNSSVTAQDLNSVGSFKLEDDEPKEESK